MSSFSDTAFVRNNPGPGIPGTHAKGASSNSPDLDSWAAGRTMNISEEANTVRESLSKTSFFSHDSPLLPQFTTNSNIRQFSSHPLPPDFPSLPSSSFIPENTTTTGRSNCSRSGTKTFSSGKGASTLSNALNNTFNHTHNHTSDPLESILPTRILRPRDVLFPLESQGTTVATENQLRVTDITVRKSASSKDPSCLAHPVIASKGHEGVGHGGKSGILPVPGRDASREEVAKWRDRLPPYMRHLSPEDFQPLALRGS